MSIEDFRLNKQETTASDPVEVSRKVSDEYYDPVGDPVGENVVEQVAELLVKTMFQKSVPLTPPKP